MNNIKNLAFIFLSCLAAVFLGGGSCVNTPSSPGFGGSDAKRMREICGRAGILNNCEKTDGCGFFPSASASAPGKCMPKAQAGIPGCEELDKDTCELRGFAKEACVAAQTCMPAKNFDENGFNIYTRIHKNGTTQDDQGYNFEGFNQEGFHKTTHLHRDGGQYDPAGYDYQGYNAEGFHKTTHLHKDGGQYDPAGNDYQGYNAEGFHKTTHLYRDGRQYDPAGDDYQGYNAEGFHKTTHLYRDGRQYDPAGDDYQGYNAEGFHKTTHLYRDGRQYDPAGDDYQGYNAEGFHKTTHLYRDGRQYDPAGDDYQGYNAEGFHKTTHLYRDGRQYDPAGNDYQGYNAEGFHKTTRLYRDGRQYDPAGYDFQGYNAEGFHKTTRLYRNGLQYNPAGYNYRGFNGLGMHRNNTRFDDRGFNVAGRLNCGAQYDRNGFDANMLHRDTRTAYDPRGFRWDKIHRDTGGLFAPNGLNIDGRNAAQARSAELGPCSIPGHEDYMARPNRRKIIYKPAAFPTTEDFLVAIENTCQRFEAPVRPNAGQTLAQKRLELINATRDTWLPDDEEVPPINDNPYRGVPNAWGVVPGIERENVFKVFAQNLVGPNKYKKVVGVVFAGEAGIDAGGLTKEFRQLVGEKMQPMFKNGPRGKIPKEDFNDFAQCTYPGQPATKENCWKNIGGSFAKLSFIEGGTFRGDNQKIFPYVGVPSIGLSPILFHVILGNDEPDLVNLLAILMIEDPVKFNFLLELMALGAADLDDQVLDMADGQPVTDQNILAYVLEEAQKPFKRDSIRWFKEGYRDMIVGIPDAGEARTPNELALVFGGIAPTVDGIAPYIRVSNGEMRYKNWLLEIMREELVRDPEFITKLLRFWTGSGSLPGQDITLRPILDPNAYPTGHTCFNNLDIGPYADKGTLKRRLLEALMQPEGFHIH